MTNLLHRLNFLRSVKPGHNNIARVPLPGWVSNELSNPPAAFPPGFNP